MKYCFLQFISLKQIFISILIVGNKASSSEFERTEIATGSKMDIPDNISWKTWHNSSIGFQLTEISDVYNIVEIVLPGLQAVFPLCYPRSFQESVDAAIVSHIICRQMGYTSFESMQEKRISYNFDLERILPSSLGCSGNEHSISQCNWSIKANRYCSELLAIKCADCSKEIRDVAGIIRNPGYPHIFPHTVLCEWKIVVPNGHFIELVVNYFSLPNEHYSNCGIHSAHLEIIHSEENSYRIQRFCKLQNGRNITIHNSEAKLRLFTGINHRRVYEEDYGVYIKFRAVPVLEKSMPLVISVLMIAVVCLAIIVLCIVVYGCIKCYQKQDRGDKSVSISAPPNAPSNEDILQGYEFQRMALRNKAQETEVACKIRTNSKSSEFRENEDSICLDPSCIEPPEIQKMPWPSTSATTPRNIFPKIGKKGKKVAHTRRLRLSKPKTNLLAKFSRNDSESNDSRKLSDSSVFVPPGYPPFEIYHSVSSAGSQKDKKIGDTFIISNLSRSPAGRRRLSNVPSIVIHHVDGYAESVPMDTK